MGAMASEPTLGTRIRRARERRRWTQQQLADALGVSVRTVNDWENDRTQPRNSMGAIEHLLGPVLTGEQAQPEIPEKLRREIEKLSLPTWEWIVGWLTGEIARQREDNDPPQAREG